VKDGFFLNLLGVWPSKIRQIPSNETRSSRASLNPLFRLLGNHLILWLFHELSMTDKAFVFLLAIMDATIFFDCASFALRAG
jgi:hypothetical protein